MIRSHARKVHNKKGLIEYNKANGIGCNDDNIYNNKCRFRCIRCGHKSSAWKELRRHVSCSHLSLFNKGSELNPYEYATVRNFYECRICGERLLHDAWIITSHNLKQHKSLRPTEKLPSRRITKGNMQNEKDVSNDNVAIEVEDKENARDDERRSGAVRKSSRKIRKNKLYVEGSDDGQEIQGEKLVISRNGKPCPIWYLVFTNSHMDLPHSHKIRQGLYSFLSIIVTYAISVDGEDVQKDDSAWAAAETTRDCCVFTCKECGKKYKSWSVLREHISDKQIGRAS